MSRKLKGQQLYLFYVDKEIEHIQHWMLKSDAYLLDCFRAIYNQQTLKEKREGKTISKNLMGFMRTDSYLLSAMAESKQYDIPLLRKRMLKYARQIRTIQHERLS